MHKRRRAQGTGRRELGARRRAQGSGRRLTNEVRKSRDAGAQRNNTKQLSESLCLGGKIRCHEGAKTLSYTKPI